MEKGAQNKVSCLHFSDVEPIPFNTDIDIPCKACNNCWKPIHLGICADLRQHEHCFNCGRIGVHMATCPRCFKAYPRYCERKIKDGIDRVLPEVEKDSVDVTKADVPVPQPSRLSVFRTFSSALINNKSWSAVLQDKDEGYSSQNGSVCNESTSNKVNNSSLKFSRDYVHDLKTLMESIKHLSIANQNIITLQFVADRNNYIMRLKSQR